MLLQPTGEVNVLKNVSFGGIGDDKNRPVDEEVGGLEVLRSEADAGRSRVGESNVGFLELGSSKEMLPKIKKNVRNKIKIMN